MVKLLASLRMLALAACAALLTLPAAAQDSDADAVAVPLCLVADGQGVGEYVATFVLMTDPAGTSVVGTARITHPSVQGDQPIEVRVHGTVFTLLVRAEPVLHITLQGDNAPALGNVLSAALVTPSLIDEDGMSNVMLNGNHIIADGTVSDCGET